MRLLLSAGACIVIEFAFQGHRNLWYYGTLGFVLLLINRPGRDIKAPPSILFPGPDHAKNQNLRPGVTDSKAGLQPPGPTIAETELVDESPPVNSTEPVGAGSDSGTAERKLDAKIPPPHRGRAYVSRLDL
jgi:hypothetical protein